MIASHCQNYIDAVPDCRLEIRNEKRDGHTVTVEWTYRGTHTGELPNLPARGAAVALEGVGVCDMDGDLIREERVYFDLATLLAGAGVLGQEGRRCVSPRGRGSPDENDAEVPSGIDPPARRIIPREVPPRRGVGRTLLDDDR